MINIRPYRGLEDLNAMRALCQAAWRAWTPQTHYHVGDLNWRLKNPDYEQQLFLCENAHGQLVAFVEFEGEDLDMQLHPEVVSSGIRAEILKWGEEQAQERARRAGKESVTLTAWSAEDDVAWIGLLAKRGYTRTNTAYCMHQGPLREPVTVPELPEGFLVRSLQGAVELEVRVKGHQDAWEAQRTTLEMYRRMMGLPDYRFELDFIVVAPDGRIVSCANGWLDTVNGVGLFEPVATHPEFRRMGMGKALIRYGMQQMQRFGMVTSHVVTNLTNEAANTLYTRCGMPIIGTHYGYERTLTVV